MFTIDHQLCAACKLCLNNCPFGALYFENDELKVNDLCTLCGACVNICRFHRAAHRKKTSLAGGACILSRRLYLDGTGRRRNQYQTQKGCLELLGKGRLLADQLGQDLVAVVLAGQNQVDWQELGRYGADRVILCQHDLLETYSTDGYTQVMCAVITSKKPAVILYGATPHGRDFAPRVAARLRLGLTADCTSLEIDEEKQLVQTRPAFGGTSWRPSSLHTTAPKRQRCAPMSSQHHPWMRPAWQLWKAFR